MRTRPDIRLFSWRADWRGLLISGHTGNIKLPVSLPVSLLEMEMQNNNCENDKWFVFVSSSHIHHSVLKVALVSQSIEK
jgi:hypothetical protein